MAADPDTARRHDAWLDAQPATTVTGGRVHDGKLGAHESIHEPGRLRETRQATHPRNAAPPATAFTNTDGTTTEGEPVTFVPEDD